MRSLPENARSAYSRHFLISLRTAFAKLRTAFANCERSRPTPLSLLGPPGVNLPVAYRKASWSLKTLLFRWTQMSALHFRIPTFNFQIFAKQKWKSKRQEFNNEMPLSVWTRYAAQIQETAQSKYLRTRSKSFKLKMDRLVLEPLELALEISTFSSF